MRVLVYKRTHTGDPEDTGCFGCYCCMGRVRGWDYGAVIGVGGTGAKAKKNGIAGKITWIGIGPHFVTVPDERGPGVLFDHFKTFTDDRPDFKGYAPKLARRIYGRKIRAVLLDTSDGKWPEVADILKLAEGEPSSPDLAALLRPAAAVAKARPTRVRKGGC